MSKLLNAADGNVLKGAKFVKNAKFYKDMFAFYKAYEAIVSADKEKLPNYVVSTDGEFLLDGICLFIRNYASEFDFESTKLTLNYLKVLYYTIASYSADENLPELDIIQREFGEYLKASEELAIPARDEYEKRKQLADDCKAKYEKANNAYAHYIISGKICNILSIFLMCFGIFGGMIATSFYFLGKFGLTPAIVTASISVLVGFVLFFVLKFLSNSIEKNSGEKLYTIQRQKKAKDEAVELFKQSLVKYSKIECERYEYSHNFAVELSSYYKKTSFDEILKRARQYKLLTFNVKNDIENLFLSQAGTRNEIIKSLDMVKADIDSDKILAEIYGKIVDNDWLYFDSSVRFTFIKKFIEFAEKSFSWTLSFEGKGINPFGVNVKEIAKERVAYLKSGDSLLVSSKFDALMKTSHIKNSKKFNVKNVSSADELRSVKLEYLNHFLSYANLQKFNNLFYDTKIEGDASVSEEIVEQNKKIPISVMLNIKMLEFKLGLENSDFQLINKIAEDIEKRAVGKMVNIAGSRYDMLKTENDLRDNLIKSIEDFGDYIKYWVGENCYVAYKF
ncbi:MAG: hypothetical protein IJ538_00780 [Clostridia bacterium]|nr:hypothetical protein [Clostridia bacterium]